MTTTAENHVRRARAKAHKARSLMLVATPAAINRSAELLAEAVESIGRIGRDLGLKPLTRASGVREELEELRIVLKQMTLLLSQARLTYEAWFQPPAFETVLYTSAGKLDSSPAERTVAIHG